MGSNVDVFVWLSAGCSDGHINRAEATASTSCPWPGCLLPAEVPDVPQSGTTGFRSPAAQQRDSALCCA